MKACDVLVRVVSGFGPFLHVPTVFTLHVTHSVPSTRDNMVDYHDKHEETEDADENETPFGLDAFDDVVDNPMCLHNAQQAQEPQKLEEFAEAHIRHAGRSRVSCYSCFHRQCPVDDYDGEVERKPRLHVMSGDRLHMHDDYAFRVETHQERARDIEGPEDGGSPLHNFGDVGPCFVPKDHHGNEDQVVADEQHTKHVPSEALRRFWRQHEFRQEGDQPRACASEFFNA
mmetsp:Transcript_82928/g.231266  ORF Transcript_82928/g.231266 Transcript_82928/m.231266 type:complete len:229 (+) Transcript_82928:1527-2213(+)